LYFESRQGAKLGLAAVFTFLFAASVALLPSAKRVEVFGASAAYVQVLGSDWSTASVLIVMLLSSLCILLVLDVPCEQVEIPIFRGRAVWRIIKVTVRYISSS
jgi:hypothetical protein